MPPVEEAGIDAVAGLQVLIDGVNQLNQPSKSLQPWLQGSTVHTDLLASTHLLPAPHPPMAMLSLSRTCSRGLLEFRSLSYHSRLPLYKGSSMVCGKEERQRRAEGLGYSRSRAGGWGTGG